jgi:hypothetical protein
MSKSVDDRYESMQSFALAISRLLKSDSDGDRTTARSSKKVSPELVRTKEQFELARSLYQEGQFAGAVSIMEKMISVDQTPNQHVNQYSKWAQETLPNAKAEETALMGFADDGTTSEDLWNAVDESVLPPKRKRTKTRRKKKAKSLAYTFMAGAAGAIAVLIAATTIQKALRSRTLTPSPIASADSVPAVNNSDDSENSGTPTDPESPEQQPTETETPASDTSDQLEDSDRRPRDNRPRPGRRNPVLDRLLNLDKDQNKQLSLQEVESASGPRNGMARRLLEQFHEFDRNSDDTLDRTELESVMRTMDRESNARQQLRRGPKTPDGVVAADLKRHGVMVGRINFNARWAVEVFFHELVPRISRLLRNQLSHLLFTVITNHQWRLANRTDLHNQLRFLTGPV